MHDQPVMRNKILKGFSVSFLQEVGIWVPILRAMLNVQMVIWDKIVKDAIHSVWLISNWSNCRLFSWAYLVSCLTFTKYMAKNLTSRRKNCLLTDGCLLTILSVIIKPHLGVQFVFLPGPWHSGLFSKNSAIQGIRKTLM